MKIPEGTNKKWYSDMCKLPSTFHLMHKQNFFKKKKDQLIKRLETQEAAGMELQMLKHVLLSAAQTAGKERSAGGKFKS